MAKTEFVIQKGETVRTFSEDAINSLKELEMVRFAHSIRAGGRIRKVYFPMSKRVGW